MLFHRHHCFICLAVLVVRDRQLTQSQFVIFAVELLDVGNSFLSLGDRVTMRRGLARLAARLPDLYLNLRFQLITLC